MKNLSPGRLIRANVEFNASRVVLISLFLILVAGLVGIVAAQSVDHRAALVGTLQGLMFWLMVMSVIVTTSLGVAFLFTREPPVKLSMQSAALIAGISFAAFYSLNVSHNRLRLEANANIQVGKDFIFIGGSMPHSLTAMLERTVHPSVPINRVILSSSGGSVAQAIEASQWFRDRGIRRVVVEGDCASACAFLALMMPERYLAPGAALGFHEMWGNQKNEVLATQAELFARFSINGVNTDALGPLFEKPEMQFPSRRFLLENRLITGCWEQEKREPEPCSE